MMFAVWVDKGYSSELVKFSHDGRKKRSLVAHAINVAAANEGEALSVSPVGGGPTEVRHITAKTRRALLAGVDES
jgi:hypothetical protein